MGAEQILFLKKSYKRSLKHDSHQIAIDRKIS